MTTFGIGRHTVHHGDCIETMQSMDSDGIDAVVTDPPYGLEFMGRDWDAPWRYSFGDTGYTDGERMPRPNHSSTRNPVCRTCRKHKRGTDCCLCQRPDFDETPADSSRLFQAWCEQWARECLRVLRPGGHLLAFGGSRTWHRLASAIEDAGFEMRDSIAWLYGSGFPKSLDVSKAIDKAVGAERTEVVGSRGLNPWREGAPGGSAMKDDGGIRQSFEQVDKMLAPATDDAKQWSGWGTALKPAHEPIVVARKPLIGTVAKNVLEHGTGGLNIDGCRVGATGRPLRVGDYKDTDSAVYEGRLDDSLRGGSKAVGVTNEGRWPPNVVMDEGIAGELDRLGGYDDAGGPSRFFPVFKYQAKAPKKERPKVDGVAHPTVKPLELMRWLVRLVTPPDGVILDPFLGSGTTLQAADLEGFRCIGIEREDSYLPLIYERMGEVLA
jgi:DNA modification methylase